MRESYNLLSTFLFVVAKEMFHLTHIVTNYGLLVLSVGVVRITGLKMYPSRSSKGWRFVYEQSSPRFIGHIS